MPGPSSSSPSSPLRHVRPSGLEGRERYQLLTSLVVPRPIGWISTWSGAGVANLAPYSFFNALSASPMLVGVSVGRRRGEPKDTLRNIRRREAFCVNVVSEDLLEAMNLSSAEVDPEIDEFVLTGLEAARAREVDAPFVARAPAVLECRLFQEVDLGEASSVLLIGEVENVALRSDLETVPGTVAVEPTALKPVGRLGVDRYSLLGEVRVLPRPPKP